MNLAWDAAPVPSSNKAVVRRAAADGSDAALISSLVGDYLRQTEAEKREHGESQPHEDSTTLPDAYLAEVADPQHYYRNDTVLVAEVAGHGAGVCVLRPMSDAAEIKRLWTDPSYRGQGLGKLLLDSALDEADGPVHLTVWDWRESVVKMYERHGFVRTASWDARPRLLCMERAASR